VKQLLEQALETAHRLPPEYQDEIARNAASCARRARAGNDHPAHLLAVMEGFDQAKRREFARGAEVAEVEAALRNLEGSNSGPHWTE
jgi:hypothetical protein